MESAEELSNMGFNGRVRDLITVVVAPELQFN